MVGTETREISETRALCQRFVAETALTMEEVARATGVSRATLYRYLRGEKEPPLSFLRSLALCSGSTVDITVSPYHSPRFLEAIVEAFLDVHPSSESQEDVAHLCDLGAPSEHDQIILAASLSNPYNRQGVRVIPAQFDLSTLTYTARYAGGSWAFSGAPALSYGGYEDMPVTLIYTENIDRLWSALSERHGNPGGETLLLPTLEICERYGFKNEGVNYVSPLHMVIDAIGIGGQSRKAGLSILSIWEQE